MTATTPSSSTRTVRDDPHQAAPRLDWRVRFALLSLIWGFSFLLIKIGTQAYAPLQVTLGRMVFGAAVLVAALALRREGLPRGGRVWGHLLVSSFLLNALPYSLFAYAELTIPSALAGIVNATSPLFAMLLSLAALSEDRPTRRRIVGLVVGFVGVLVVLGAWRGFSYDPAGTVMALCAALCYALGWLYVRRTLANRPHSHLSIASGQLLLATAQMVIVTPLFTSFPDSFPVGPLLAVAALGALGTGLAVLLQHSLVAEVGPTIGQMVTYFIPVIATAAGIVLLDEHLTWNTFVGAAIVLAGAGLSQQRKKRPATPRNEEASRPSE